MNITIDLGKLGNKETKNPSLGAIMELVTLWASHGEDPSLLARICAGAIGVSIDHHSILPKYRPAIHKPLEYGHICLDRLLEKGVTSSKIYESGTQLLASMAGHLPQEEIIEETMGFLEQGSESSKD